jgi:hypothetical protein
MPIEHGEQHGAQRQLRAQNRPPNGYFGGQHESPFPILKVSAGISKAGRKNNLYNPPRHSQKTSRRLELFDQTVAQEFVIVVFSPCLTGMGTNDFRCEPQWSTQDEVVCRPHDHDI